MSLKKLITLENLQSFYDKLPSWSKNSTKPEYNYSEINNTPTLGTAASKDVAAGGGNAGNNEVVMGNDSRLTNSRNPLAHNQASSTIDSMASYSKPSSAPATPAIQASDSLNTAIGKLEYKADTNQTNILSAESMVCDNAFSTSTAYAEGDIVTYDHKLYKFKTAHSAGAWNSSHVDQISTTGLITPELIELCDSGAKNLVDVANATVSANGYVVQNASVSIPAGSYKVSFTTTASSGNLVVTVKNSSSTSVGSVTIAQTAGTKTGDLTVTGTGATLTVQSTSAATISNFMICSQAAWNVSHKYVPYRPNWDLVSSVAPFYSVPINHNMIYRGNNLGATFTDAQHTALSSGNFTDLYLGDYWTKSVTIPAGTYTGGDGEEVTVAAQTVTLKAVIADFDTFYAGYASSYTAINTHHAGVIVTGFNNVVWNKTDSTAGGYVSSLIHKWLVGSVLPQIETWFGSAKVLSHQKLLTNAITGDAASGWAWSSQKISLLSECQLYGMKVWGGSKATNGAYEPGEAFKKLDVFNHIDANLLFGNKNIWCRDIASAGRAASLGNGGDASCYDASNTRIAPAALILLS